MKIFAGIITYNPDMDKLMDNIKVVLPQVDGLLIVDNGSENTTDINKLIQRVNVEHNPNFTDILFRANEKNKGVAYALNQIMNKAESLGANWVLTLDDDTEIYPDLLSKYRKFIESEEVEGLASISCLRKDRQYKEKNRAVTVTEVVNSSCQEYDIVKTCITSGNLVLVDAWRQVKGFNNRLFIDMVDDDFCLKLGEKGYKIARLNTHGFLHEMGENIQHVSFMGKDKVVFGYSPIRKYYTARNIRYIVNRYHMGLNNEYTRYLIKRIVGTLFYEKNKLKGLTAYIKGYKAGRKLFVD